jgi:hypothetical protein
MIPGARQVGLVTSEVGGEVLVYDQDSNHIHQLNETSAAVWRLCDGRRSVTNIAMAADLVRLALAKLADANLLAGELATDVRVTGKSRRAFMKKAAVAGTIAIPVVASVSAPTAAGTSSTGNGTCPASVQNCNQATVAACCPGGFLSIGSCAVVGAGANRVVTVVCLAI